MAAAVGPSKLQLLDADERIVGGILCVRCGVPLSGQSIHERCANCMHPISDSVYGDYLIHSDKPLVRRLAESARFILYGASLLAALGFITVIASLLGARDFPDAVVLMFNALVTMAMISPILCALGVLSLTTKGTAAYYMARYLNQNALMKWGALAVVLLAGVIAAEAYARQWTNNILLLLWVTTPSVLFFHGLAKLMTRVPNQKLAVNARAHLYVMLALGLISVSVLFLRHLAAEERQWTDMLTGATMIAVIGALGFLTSAFVLLRAVYVNLSQIAR